MHKLGKCSLPSKFFQRQRAKRMQFSAPEERGDSGSKERKQNRLERSPRSSLTTLQLYTSAVCEHKMSYNRAAGCECVCVWTGSRMFLQDTQEYRHRHTGGGCDHKLQKKRKFNFCCKNTFIFFPPQPIETSINILPVCPCQAGDLNYFCGIYFLFSLSESWSSGFLRLLRHNQKSRCGSTLYCGLFTLFWMLSMFEDTLQQSTNKFNELNRGRSTKHRR